MRMTCSFLSEKRWFLLPARPRVMISRTCGRPEDLEILRRKLLPGAPSTQSVRNRHSPKLPEEYHLAQQAEESCLKSTSSPMTGYSSSVRGLIHQRDTTGPAPVCPLLFYNSAVLLSLFQSLVATWGLMTTNALTTHDMLEIVWSNGDFICTVDRNKSAGFSCLGSNRLTCCPSDTSIAA